MRGSLRMEDHVVEAVVAVHDRRLVAGRDARRQPLDQALDRLDRLGLGGRYCLVQRATWRSM